MWGFTWTNYKHHNAFKVIVIIAPTSDIKFISLAYPGSISDREITKTIWLAGHDGTLYWVNGW